MPRHQQQPVRKRRVSEEVAHQLCRVIQTGNRDERDRATAQLLKEYSRYIRHMVHIYARWLDVDEAQSVTALALWKAARSFDRRRRFSPWLAIHLRSALIDANTARQRYERGIERHLGDLEPDGTGGDVDWNTAGDVALAVADTGPQSYEDIESVQRAYRVLRGLCSPLECDCWLLYEGAGHTYPEIVSLLRRRYPGVRWSVRTVDNALTRLRRKLERWGHDLQRVGGLVGK